jgi:hypothetical protein
MSVLDESIKNNTERERYVEQTKKNSFINKSNKVYKNNVEGKDYTVNDFNFLEGLNKMYGMAMSAKGLNVLDPIAANMLHYNKMGMRGNADYPRVSRTYCFFTRPELNFSYENIVAVPFFQWLYSKKIGKLIMASLTDPEYFINAPAILNNDNNGKISEKDIIDAMNSYHNAMRRMQKDQAKVVNAGGPYAALWDDFDAETSNAYDPTTDQYIANESDYMYHERIRLASIEQGRSYASVKAEFDVARRKAKENQKWTGVNTNTSTASHSGGGGGTSFDNSSSNTKKKNKKTEKQKKTDEEKNEELENMNFGYMQDMDAIENIIGNSGFERTKLEQYYQQGDSAAKEVERLQKHFYDMMALHADPNAFREDSLRALLNNNGCYQAKKIFNTADNTTTYYPGFNFTSPFIPLLGNTCVQCSGARDLNLESYQYEEDEYGMSQKVATGMDELWGPGTLSTNFEDIAYSPVSLLFMAWVMYIHYVSRGYIHTTRDHVLERILDYTCSIYIFVIGEDGRRIERWGKFTGCYPTTFPLTQQLEHNANPDPEMLHKLTISWQYNRFEPMDPQIFTDFNFLSESEWLVKLQSPFWENLYSRHDTKKSAILQTFKDISDYDNYDNQKFWKNLNRNPDLWTQISAANRGMSGKIPMTLIHSIDPSSQINALNNYWGGYPYINKGTDLIWVLPQYGSETGVIKYGKVGTNQYPQSDLTRTGDGTKTANAKLKPDQNGSIRGSDIGLSNKDDLTGADSNYYLDGKNNYESYYIASSAI